MDNPDLLLDLNSLTSVSLLGASLWADGALARSLELTPLYVQRYAGPHAGRRLTLHPFWEMIHVFRGQGTLLGPAPASLREGTTFLIPPGLRHVELSAAPMDLLWMGLQGSRLQALPTEGAQRLHSEEMGEVFEELWLRVQRPYGAIGAELDGLATAALSRFSRLVGEKNRPPVAVVDQVLTYIQRNFARPISITSMASRFGYSEGYLHRMFRAGTGKTPLQYLTQLRIEAALRLMRQSSLSISRIAHLCGYADPLYFSRVFRQVAGKSPKAAILALRGTDAA